MYFSGSFREVVARRMIERNAPRLFTYAYPKEAYMYLNIATAQGIRCDIMIDSGAFTAWNKGKPVELPELLQYHDRLLDTYGHAHDFVFIALDIISGERGRMATPEEIEDGMQRSMDNFIAMQEHHQHPVLPVYHTGEPVSFRDAFLERCDYICLSMNQNLTEKERVAWAMEAQVSGTRMHGLAATGSRIMEYVDWFSVDSAGWLMTAAMGKILWYNGRRFQPLDISDNNPSLKQPGKHVFNMPGKEYILDTIASMGYDPQVLSTSYIDRCFWNIDVWTSFEPKKQVRREEGLFAL